MAGICGTPRDPPPTLRGRPEMVHLPATGPPGGDLVNAFHDQFPDPLDAESQQAVQFILEQPGPLDQSFFSPTPPNLRDTTRPSPQPTREGILDQLLEKVRVTPSPPPREQSLTTEVIDLTTSPIRSRSWDHVSQGKGTITPPPRRTRRKPREQRPRPISQKSPHRRTTPKANYQSSGRQGKDGSREGRNRYHNRRQRT